MSDDQALPAAGWYPDPADASRIRWWDGQKWTEHVAVSTLGQPSAPSSGTSPSSDTSAPVPATRAGRNAQTKLTLWAGLFIAITLWALSTLITTMG